jgi:hypothetical protein
MPVLGYSSAPWPSPAPRQYSPSEARGGWTSNAGHSFAVVALRVGERNLAQDRRYSPLRPAPPFTRSLAVVEATVPDAAASAVLV